MHNGPTSAIRPCYGGHITEGRIRTANQDHLPLPSLVTLDERHDDWSTEIAKPRCYGTDDRNIAVVCKFRNFGVVFLEHTE